MKKDAVFDRCPKCKAVAALRRSRGRTLAENIVKKSGVFNIYRCRECGWRGLKTSLTLRDISLKKILFYILMILVSAYIINYLLKKFVL